MKTDKIHDSVTFQAQIAAGKGAINFEGTKDGAEVKLFIPETQKHLIASLPYYFLQKKLSVTLKIIKD